MEAFAVNHCIVESYCAEFNKVLLFDRQPWDLATYNQMRVSDQYSNGLFANDHDWALCHCHTSLAFLVHFCQQLPEHRPLSF